MFGEVPEFDPWVEKANQMDLYLYLDAKAPYIDDGTRLSESKRNELDEIHKKMFSKMGINVNTLVWPNYKHDFQAYGERLKEAIKIIDNFITKY